MHLTRDSWQWLMMVSGLAALVTWIVVARQTSSLQNPKQGKALRLCGWITILISIAFPLILQGADFIGGGVPNTTVKDAFGFAFFAVILAVLHSIPGLTVLVCWFLYWKLQEYRVRDDWILAFTFTAVQAPNLFIMMYWIVSALLDQIRGRSEALDVTWVEPIKLIPITLPIGVLLGLAAFEVARRIRDLLPLNSRQEG